MELCNKCRFIDEDTPTLESTTAKTTEIIQRLKNIDLNKKLQSVKETYIEKTADVESGVMALQMEIKEIEKNIGKYERRYNRCRITEDEQFTVLGKIYKKDYDSFRTSLE
ncbi:hypothetical protein CDIK_3417, partial [Cucumispora dikerogammari]